MTSRRTEYLRTPEALSAALEQWRAEPTVAVDTESNSFFVYRERTCLLQVSTPSGDWIVDPLEVDLSPVGALLADPAVEKVFHAGEGDVLLLKREFGFTFTRLFDTLIAAKAVGRKRLGLSSLAEDMLGLKLAKDEQRSDWGRRPLSESQIEYAYADTRHLLELADRLRAEVAARGEVVAREVVVDCERLAARQPRPREIAPDAFERHPSAKTLDPVARQVLRCLYEAREKRAQETDRPPFRIAPDALLGEIAVRKPTSRAALAQVPGATPPIVHRHGVAFVEAVRQALELGPLPRVSREWVPPDPAEEARHESLRQWRRQVAEARGVEVDVIAGNAAVRALARANPRSLEEVAQVAELDAFRAERYGEAILGALAEAKPSTQAARRRGRR